MEMLLFIKVLLTPIIFMPIDPGLAWGSFPTKRTELDSNRLWLVTAIPVTSVNPPVDVILLKFMVLYQLGPARDIPVEELWLIFISFKVIFEKTTSVSAIQFVVPLRIRILLVTSV